MEVREDVSLPELNFRWLTVGPAGQGYKRDPRALELALRGYPECDCIVRGPSGYPWHDAGFRPPAFHDLIVYQFHIGVYYAVDEQGSDIRRDRVSKFLDVLGRLEHLVGLGVRLLRAGRRPDRLRLLLAE